MADRRKALAQLIHRDVEIEYTLLGIDHDRVAVADRRDGSADRGLRRDVTDHVTVRRAGEAAVGDERDLVAEALANDRAGHAQHLAHAGAALRSLVTDDHDVAFLDLLREDRG